MGWATYFGFILAAINTFTVTYYLAIERAPFLKELFPSFVSYIIIVGVIAVPILIAVGWIHYRKTAAYASEAEITIESNPYYYKLPPGWQREVLFPVYFEMIQFIIKTSKNEKLSDEDITRINKLQERINLLLKGGQIGSPRKSVDVPSF